MKNIQINLKALESMLFIWASLQDKEKIADQFFIELADSPEMAAAYGEDFDANSFRKVLSAIANHELLSDASQREKRFWNYNMWMLEDLGVTQLMLEPLKTLNLSDRLGELADFPYEEAEIIFYPGSTETATLRGNQLFVNFFRVHVDLMDPDGEATIEDQPIPDFLIASLLGK